MHSISICDHLIRYGTLGVSILILGTLGIVVNILAFLTHQRSSEEHSPYTIIIKNLTVSDICFPLYLLVIFAANFWYGGNYGRHDIKWRSSVVCLILSILSGTAPLVSNIFIALLAVLRYILVSKLHVDKYILSKICIATALSVWIACLAFTSLLVLMTKGLSPNSFCLMNTSIYIGGASSIIIVLSLVTETIFYMKMLVYIKSVGQQLKSVGNVTKTDKQLKVAMSVVLQVLCHDILWLPIIVLTLMGSDVSPVIMVATLTTTIPLNSCLNPIIHTLSSKESRQIMSRFIRRK